MTTLRLLAEVLGLALLTVIACRTHGIWKAVRAAAREEQRPQPPGEAEAESARRAREAIEKFNTGIASILNYEAGAHGEGGGR